MTKDDLHAELEKKYELLEADLQKALDAKHDALEKVDKSLV